MQLHNSPDLPKIWTDDLANARAQQIGLPGTLPLRYAVDLGAGAARAVTDDHPPSYRGYRMWAETVAGLRSRLRPAGWEREDLANIPLVVYRDEPLTIITVAPGEAHTGSRGHPEGPRLRYTKGEFSTRFYNGEYDDLWARTYGSEYSVWFLVHELTGLYVRSELSLPTRLDDSGQVEGWAERIILPEIGFEPEPSRLREPERPNSPVILPDVSLRDAG
jgi:hypothetical protein